jgi:hypothetical protein
VLERYRRLAEIAPAEATTTVELLIAHEVALARFASRAMSSEPAVLAPVEQVLELLAASPR